MMRGLPINQNNISFVALRIVGGKWEPGVSSEPWGPVVVGVEPHLSALDYSQCPGLLDVFIVLTYDYLCRFL